MKKWYEGTGGSGELKGIELNTFKWDLAENVKVNRRGEIVKVDKRKPCRLTVEPSEKQIQNTILDWLTVQKIFNWQVDNTGIFDPIRGRYRLNPRKTKGVPDIFCVYKGRAIGIEVKSRTGRLSEYQKIFGEGLNEAGGFYLLARDIETVERFFKWIDQRSQNQK